MKEKKLKKELALIDVFSIATGALISSGLFILAGFARGLAGPAVVVSYLLAGALAATGMLSIAEITTAMPKAGGDYFFIMRSFGPGMGTVAGILSWFALSMKTAFALVGMAAFTVLIPGLRHLDIRLISVLLCLVFMVINTIGVKEAGRTQVVLVLGLLLILSVYVIRGLPRIEVRNFEVFAPYGAMSLFATAGFVFTSYGGLLGIASISEEVKDPGKTIPKGLILSMLVTTILYVVVVFVTVGVISKENFNPESLTPISDGASMFMGRGGVMLLSIAAILAFVSTANAGILSASRYLLGLSRDKLAPGFLRTINARFRTPHFPIMITGLFIISVLFLELRVLVKATSAGIILTNIFANLCLIILRESRVQNYKPSFRSPFYPWVQIAGIIGFSLLLTGIGREAFVSGLALFTAGFLLYWFYGRSGLSREYALLHLIERITDKELQSGMLEYELKEIVRDRDQIKTDRFDRVVEKSTVMDLKRPVSMQGFLKLASQQLSEKTGTRPQKLYNLLLEREKQGTTEITPGMAVPHTFVNGSGVFELLMARSRRGIKFSPGPRKVHAVFVLVCSKDEKTFYLRMLAGIAQVIHDEHFLKKWSSAKNEAALRDLLLLGQRKRTEG